MRPKKAQIVAVTKDTHSMFPKSIVESKLTVTPNQLDVIAMLLAEIAKPDDKDKNLDYTITAKDYAELKGYTNPKEAYTVLRNNVCGEGTMHKTSMRHIGFDMWMGDDLFEQYNWFSHIRYDKGNVQFTLTPQIKKLLVEFKHNDTYKVFAKLRYILPMRSQYSKRIYLMCREYISSGERFCDTTWTLFLEKLGLDATYSYAKIKERILDKAQEEINSMSDITISYKVEEVTVKGGKKPVSIKFTIDKKEIYDNLSLGETIV